MCGLFFISGLNIVQSQRNRIYSASERRGKDASGVCVKEVGAQCVVHKEYSPLKILAKKVVPNSFEFICGHSRLMTNGARDNQPLVTPNSIVFHNGIILNVDELTADHKLERNLEIDSEVLSSFIERYIDEKTIPEILTHLLSLVSGTLNAIILFPKHGKAAFISNHGSLYFGTTDKGCVVTSEEATLKNLNITDIENIKNSFKIIEINSADVSVADDTSEFVDYIPALIKDEHLEDVLEYQKHNLQRCSKCILPSSMPFIYFDKDGVCNYCQNYRPVVNVTNFDLLHEKVEKYRRSTGSQPDCIVPFSGGRDSCFALHVICKELNLNPITYTYDWGMVTDLGRRNISLMCAKLGVENIIIAADLNKKRANIKKNLIAWLTNPNIGLLSLLTAGDKFFFKYVDEVKRETGISLNIWGINPLETTHFKTGFLNQKPAFEQQNVYISGLRKQMGYHSARFREMFKGSGFINSSIPDTLLGEYYRSINQKKDYIHLFDFIRWDENKIEDVLDSYNWERATDTSTTWRIGDGTAAFYNYATYTLAGFTEHDTFRSNQIREGMMTREKALALVNDENKPRTENLRWYFDTLDVDGIEIIKKVNAFPKTYRSNLGVNGIF